MGRMTKRRTSPGDVQKIIAQAREMACGDCCAAPGEPCTGPGSGRSVCKIRYVSAAIELKQALKAAVLTLEQQAIFAGLPRLPTSEIEKCRTPAGGYSFTKTWFLEHRLPYPPVAGWRQAVEREEP